MRLILIDKFDGNSFSCLNNDAFRSEIIDIVFPSAMRSARRRPL